MPKHGGKQRESEAQERSSFRWPSRELASASERAADLAATRGLERLRARAERLRATPRAMQAVPPAPRAPAPAPTPTPPPPPPPRRAVPEPERPQTPEPEREREPAPAPWDEELDALTEQLIADLRRDLGPETP